MSRLALGTAQFGLNYGIANEGGQVGPEMVAAILARAAAANVDTLDTAIAYGNSEVVLGAAGVDAWHVITKLPGLSVDVGDLGPWVIGRVRESAERLRVPRIEAVLLHRPADLLGDRGAEYREALTELKRIGLARAVGVSIYDPAECEALWRVWKPDIVQAPCNVLDRRLQTSRWLDRFASEGVRLHVRSVFLQGLLLMGPGRRPAWFDRWRPLLDRWFAWSAASGLSPLAASVAFVNSLPHVERYVVGVETVTQLEEILSADKQRPVHVPEDLSSDDPELLNPSRWKLT
jgi:aryl-alcohol dehydrogenase-like predicted oxidoreductase